MGKRRDSIRLKATERRVKALELRKRGASYRDIGDALGVSHTTAAKDVKKALAQLNKQEAVSAEQYRRLSAERINVARIAIAHRVMQGDLPSIDRWLKLNEQEIKLYGLNEPEVLKLGLSDETAQSLSMLLAVMEQHGHQASDLFNGIIAKYHAKEQQLAKMASGEATED